MRGFFMHNIMRRPILLIIVCIYYLLFIILYIIIYVLSLCNKSKPGTLGKASNGTEQNIMRTYESVSE